MQVANHKQPPGRVRAMFKRMDKDSSGGLTMDELLKGFEKELKSKLAPHVVQKMREAFDKVATDDAAGGKSLKVNHFSRYYCEVLFRHFDKNNDNVLQLAEVSEALKFMVKPNASGVQVAPIVAYPPEFTDASGEVALPIQWFWATFSAMD